MPLAVALVIERVGLRMNADHTLVNFDQRRRLVSRQRRTMSNKLQLFDFLQHRYRLSLSLWERVRVRALARKKKKNSPSLSAPSAAACLTPALSQRGRGIRC